MRKMKIRSKLIFIFIVLFTIPVLIASFIFSHYARSFGEEKSLDLNIQNMNYIGASVDLVFNYVYNYSLYPPFDDSIVSFLTAEIDSSEYHDLRRSAIDSIILLPYTNSTIKGVGIWRNDGRYIQSGKGAVMGDLEKDVLVQMKGAPKWDYKRNGKTSEIYLSRLLKNPLNLQDNIGFMKICLDNQALENAFSNKNGNSSIYFIMDEEGEVIYQSEEEEEIRKVFPKVSEDFLRTVKVEDMRQQSGTSWYQDEAGCYVTPHGIGNTGWILFGISQNSFSMNLSKSLNQVFFLFILICIPSCTLLAMVFSAVILSPLKRMGELMHQIEKENFSVHLDIKSNDELAVLARQFNHMSDELSDLYNRVYLGNIRLKEAQLAALQSQINPHFLYNTLDTIYWMSEFNGTQDVSSMVSALSQLFRLSLSGDQNDRIPLSSELEHIKCFLYIEKIRYDDQLDYTIEFLDEYLEHHAQDYMVLKLVLQPIAENAIIHGIDKNGFGSIHIIISLEGDYIQYEVSNTGNADIDYINQILENPTHQTSSIGLSNIQQRIHLKYGKDFGIVCFNRENDTVFRVRLPVQPF